MSNRIEKTYGGAVRGIFIAVNPLKKKFLKTYCTVHKFIVIQALEILKNDGYIEEHFKSSNHFYHFSMGKGLYGFSNALTECKKYYEKSLHYLDEGNVETAMFYFGASCHLIQDVTVPQHVNNKLLKSHRGFELWIISKLMNDYSFMANDGVVRYKKLDDYIINNAFLANNTYLKNIGIRDKEERYSNTASAILKEAERTTAGFMVDYYEIIKNKEAMNK